MKTIGSAILWFTLSISFASFLQAQVVPAIIAPTEVVKPSTVYRADIKVTNFRNIIGAQFTVAWDSTVLRFRDTKNFLFEQTALTEAFGKNRASSGLLTFIWVDAQLQGRNLTDGTALFAIEFDVIGTPNTFTPIRFTDDIAAREVAGTGSGAINANFQNGMITVMATTSTQTYNSAPHLIQVKESYPNPFQESTQIQFDLKTNAAVRLVITNMQGQTVYEDQRSFAAGANTLMLNKNMFPAAGAYQCSLINADFTVTQKLILF